MKGWISSTSATRVRATGAAVLLASAAAAAGHPAAGPVGGRPATMFPTFDTRRDAHFGDATAALRAYLAAPWTERHSGPQHFCIVGYRHHRDERGAWSRAAQVHLREGRRLILWEGVDPLDPDHRSLVLSPRDLDLDKDVVPTPDDVAGSTYRVTRDWVAQVLADCRRRGARYTIRP